jgi:hypothetical protein
MIYLMIDNRGFVGNDVSFWNTDGRGYTTDIDRAMRFNEEEAKRQELSRSTDIAIPEKEVYEHSRKVVDFQYLDRKYFTKGFKHFDVNATKSEQEKKLEIVKRKLNSIEVYLDEAECAAIEYGMSSEEVIAKFKELVTTKINEKVAP